MRVGDCAEFWLVDSVLGYHAREVRLGTALLSQNSEA